MVMKVVRNPDGEIINIGSWDYDIEMVPTEILDHHGEPVLREQVNNPLPEGAYECDAEIVAGWDGGLYCVDDPRAFGGDTK